MYIGCINFIIHDLFKFIWTWYLVWSYEIYRSNDNGLKLYLIRPQSPSFIVIICHSMYCLYSSLLSLFFFRGYVVESCGRLVSNLGRPPSKNCFGIKFCFGLMYLLVNPSGDKLCNCFGNLFCVMVFFFSCEI